MKTVLIFVIAAVILVIFFAQSGIFRSLRTVQLATSTVPGGFLLTPLGVKMPSPTTSTVSKNRTYINPATYTDIPKGFTTKDLSPYFRGVRVASVSVRNSGQPYDRISLSASDVSSNKTIDVTGWRVRSNVGTFIIPKAVSLYDPHLLPSAKDISLASGDTLNFYSGSSPLGFGFRLNSCMGYLDQHYKFIPQLQQTCPQIDRQSFAQLSGICQDYILHLGNCELPSFAPSPFTADASCRAYLNTLDYPGCVTLHKKDQDFLGSEWRVWFGQTFIDPLHDRILLYDAKGLLVDEYIY